MRLEYNKLVRDRTTEIIKAEGKLCKIEAMPEKEYRKALLEKLLEEAQEARQGMYDDLITELADIEEVVLAILAAWEIPPESVHQIQRQRFVERGGFNNQLKLLWTEDGNEDA